MTREVNPKALVSSFFGSEILFNDWQSSKADSPMNVTDGGIDIFANDLQRKKAPNPMDITDDGIEILLSELHPMKVHFLIDVIEG